ncbi:enoyl-CoA hydratase-related protein [Jeotgalibacillus proteolyticus]|uniref:2-(1,2-epoxy-1,2-dihydrophenyl)acetyl-CoA isomerase n=1 Tax=Jeotgalibacillus proteolyticus TaxID=2082395 RepID=A0A2S5GHA1_9BACL|nr:enoyl-CoA hydratase-related protein [Jeotgalibacillus proteolyticus]PPA72281.1 2-(1,2-epoxy-1,2-dihydrophenyl)acetyl-CoA isomerase [Jeotgalibacillus proteolyticus]
MGEAIQYECSNNIAWIRLNRTDKLNSFNEIMHKEMLLALKDAERNQEVRCIVITGNGRAFSAGEDLEGVTDDLDHGEVIRSRYTPVILQISRSKKPIVSAVNGVAAGSGLSLALACDFRLLHEKAKLVQAFIHVGLIPDSGNLFYLPKLIGHAKAMELAVFGEKISSQQAMELGLATKVITEDAWDNEVQSFALTLACLPTKAFGLIKEQLSRSWEMPLDEFLEAESYSQRIAGLSYDHKEGVIAFKEKRKPDFQGN